MTMTRLTAAVGTLALLTASTSGASAQEAQAPRTPVLRIVQTSPASTIDGELVRVDTAARMIVLRTADNKEEQLAYTNSTRVHGTQKTVAGLAGTTPTPVSVRFTGAGANRVATEITVREAKS